MHVTLSATCQRCHGKLASQATDLSTLIILARGALFAEQLAEALPAAGSGLKLPLDLHRVAALCSNSYYAPRRFAAVQLAFDSPRCRVLVFRALRAT